MRNNASSLSLTPLATKEIYALDDKTLDYVPLHVGSIHRSMYR